MKSYKTIAELERDKKNLKAGEEISFRGETLTYTPTIITYLLATRDDRELGLGAMVEEDLKRLEGRDSVSD